MKGCSNQCKVFGIGWAKTGTSTLGSALTILGYRHQSQNLSLIQKISSGDFEKTRRIAQEFDSFDDWPWILIYQELDEAFPDSKFILTIRESSRWLRSYKKMLVREGQPSKYMASLRRTIYGFDVSKASDTQLLTRYLWHNRSVQEYFYGRPSQLLIIDWEKGHGWDQLCDYLGVERPCAPFPWMNRSQE